MARIFELRDKEVINCHDGARFGYICDVEIDIDSGEVISIIIPGPGKVFGLLGHETEYIISWDCITKIGEDIILVDIETKKALKGC